MKIVNDYHKLTVLVVICAMISSGCTSTSNSSEYKLVWSDEFETQFLDKTKWRAIVGNGCPEMCGFGNKELQYYSDVENNLRIEKGILVIEAHRDSIGNNAYTSAKVETKNNGDWKYGRIVVSAKLPWGTGTWPAIWMLPTLSRKMSWPEDGEIDIMEHVGYNQGSILGTIHTEKYNHVKRTQISDSIFIQDASENFHVYGIDWTEEKIEWFVDDQVYLTIQKNDEDRAGWPFDETFHLILNLAVGGNLGGRMGIDETIWPQRMEVDYVRIYQRP